MDEREIIFDDVPQIAFGYRIRPADEPDKYLVVGQTSVAGILRNEHEEGWSITRERYDSPSQPLSNNYASPFMAILALREGEE